MKDNRSLYGGSGKEGVMSGSQDAIRSLGYMYYPGGSSASGVGTESHRNL